MPGKRILIVDDEEEILQLIDEALSNEGYEVTTAVTAGDAMSKIRKIIPDLILLDIVLPDMEGPEIVRSLKEDPLTKEIPVVFLSGIVSRENKDDASCEIRVGEDLYTALSKPFSSQELMLEVRKAMA